MCMQTNKITWHPSEINLFSPTFNGHYYSAKYFMEATKNDKRSFVREAREKISDSGVRFVQVFTDVYPTTSNPKQAQKFIENFKEKHSDCYCFTWIETIKNPQGIVYSAQCYAIFFLPPKPTDPESRTLGR